MPLNIFEPRYLSMIDHALSHDRIIGMIQPAHAGKEGHEHESIDDGAAPLYSVGCAGRITTFGETDDGRYVISLKGLVRFEVSSEKLTEEGFRVIEADFSSFRADMLEEGEDDKNLDRDRLLSVLSGYFEAQNIQADWDAIKQTETHRLVNSLAMICPFSPVEKQAILEAPNLNMRADVMEVIMEMALHQGSGKSS